jgi:prepilin-type N-terminal cleavage/methylation domain-containing protein
MRASRTSRTSTEGGFTLTELSVAMAVFLIFMAATTPFMFRNLMQALRTEGEADLQQGARAAMRTMTRELRQAGALYASTDKPSGKNSISFGVDFDGDGVLNSWNDSSRPLEQITYFMSDGGLYRGRKQGQGQLIAENVSDLRFTMFGSNLALDQNGDGIVDENELNTSGEKDANGNPVWRASELAHVTRVKVEMTVSNGSASQTYTADVWLRNRVVG